MILYFIVLLYTNSSRLLSSNSAIDSNLKNMFVIKSRSIHSIINLIALTCLVYRVRSRITDVYLHSIFVVRELANIFDYISDFFGKAIMYCTPRCFIILSILWKYDSVMRSMRKYDSVMSRACL